MDGEQQQSITYAYSNLNGIFAQTDANGTSYLFKNVHGDTVIIVRNGSIVDEATYNPYGNPKESQEVTPYTHANYYYDSNLGLYYLRNRYYDQSIGIFISEDPIKHGNNWYVYCGGNPVGFVDPLGTEYIVVSGGRYSNDDDSWGYEFIETAIKKLREWKELGDGENITWMVANIGWTNDDIVNFLCVGNEIGVNVEFIDNTDDFVNYVNTRGDNNRYKDNITKFVVFSHGKDTNGGTIELGYYHNNASEVQISIDTIRYELWATAFDNPNSWFGACNLANGGNDFASAWQEKFGGKTWGFQGKSNYKNIWQGQSWNIKLSRKLHGFSYLGCANYPVAGDFVLKDGRKSEVVMYD